MPDATFANVLVGAVVATVLVVMLVLELAHRPLLAAAAPQLPPEDRPPTALPGRTPIHQHEIAAEVDRGYLALVAYLQRRGRRG